MRLSWLVMVMATIVSSGPMLSAAEYPAAGPDVFDCKANGEEQLRAALGVARASGRRVVLMLGANWCPWCHRLDAILRHDPELAARWDRDYVLVQIDVNWKRLPKRNPGVLARYRRAPQRGIPVLTLLDADGNVLANPDISRWETAEPKDYDVAKLRSWFAEWAPPRP
jgi:thiol:disulfide interchange protein